LGLLEELRLSGEDEQGNVKLATLERSGRDKRDQKKGTLGL